MPITRPETIHQIFNDHVLLGSASELVKHNTEVDESSARRARPFVSFFGLGELNVVH